MIENDQVILIPVKIIEFGLYLLVLLALNKKYQGMKFSNRPSLHRYFLLGMAGWCFYLFFDTIIYVIAPLSIPDTVPIGTIGGYSQEYFSLLIANILRDIAMPGALLMAWVYCAAAIKLYNGVDLNEKLFGNEEPLLSSGSKGALSKGSFFKVLAIIVLFLVIIFDQINVQVLGGGEVHVTSNWGPASIFILALFTTATVLMVKQMWKFHHSDMEPEFKRRAQNLGIGIIIYTAGIYYWGLTGVIAKAFKGLESLILIFLIFGHVIWTTSALFILQAFRTKDQ